MSKKTVGIAIIILVLLGGGAYYMQSKTDTTTPSELEGTVTDSTGATSTVTIIPSDPSKLPQPIPSLTRSFSAPSPEFNAQAKKIIEDKYAVYVKELKANPSNINDWIQIGILYRMVHDNKSAEESWIYATRLSSKAAVPHKNLADLYTYDLKDNVKAEAQWKIAIELDPSDTTAYRGLFDLYRLVYTAKAEQAPGVLLGGLKTNPKDVDLMLPLAAYYKDKNDTVNARTYFQKALVEIKARGNNAALAAQIQEEIDALK